MKTYNIASRLISLLLIAGGTMSQIQIGSHLYNACFGSPEFYEVQKTLGSFDQCVNTIGGK